jgi:hypothetical protein
MTKSHETRGDARLTRRAFGGAVVALAAGTVAPEVEGAPEPVPPDVAEPVAVAQALAEVVKARHGKHLNAAQSKALTVSIARSQVAARTMRKFKLSNADEPAFTFHADLP